MGGRISKKSFEYDYDFKSNLKQFYEYKLAGNLLLSIINSEKKISVPENTNWDKLLGLIIYHNLGYVVFEKIINIPEVYKQKLKLIELATIKKNREHYDLFKKINKEFSKENIEFQPIKGITRLRENKFKRPMNDIDLWVDKKDLSRAKKVLGKFMIITEEVDSAKRDYGFCAVKGLLAVECKDIKSQINMSLIDFRKSELREEIIFCFEAHHAVMNHSYESIKWFYDGYYLFKQEKFSVDKILRAAKISKTEYLVKTYLLIIQELFGLKLSDKYFTSKDVKRRDLFFKIYNPVFPRTNIDINELNLVVKVNNSKNLKKISFLFNRLRNEENIFLTKAWQLAFFPNSFYKWLENINKNAKLIQKDMILREGNLPYYLWNMQEINWSQIDLINDVLEIIYLTSTQDIKKAKNSIKKIFGKYDVSELKKMAKNYEVEWIIDVWVYELKKIESKNSLKWHYLLGSEIINKKEEYRLFFKRRILLSSSLKIRLSFLTMAIFPSRDYSKNMSKLKIFNEWLSRLKRPKLCFSLILALFTHPK